MLKTTYTLLILFFLFSCQTLESIGTASFISTASFTKKDLISNTTTTPIHEEGSFIGNFVTKTLLHEGVLYFKELNKDRVDAYSFEDSLFVSYKYEKRPIKINDFDVSEEQVFLLSSSNENKIFVFDKAGNYLSEFELKADGWEVESSRGETLFHYHSQSQVFYIGLKTEGSYEKGIETVGVFDLSGNLVSTFGDFTEDNAAAVEGYVMSNDGMRSKLIHNKLYVLTKETSTLYGFDAEGELLQKNKLPFKKIPNKKKKLKAGKSIIMDQVMDFYVVEADSAICYTYMTDTGDFMGQKSPSQYLAYKKFSADTVLYTKVDFLKINEVHNNELLTVSKDKKYDRYVLLKSELNL